MRRAHLESPYVSMLFDPTAKEAFANLWPCFGNPAQRIQPMRCWLSDLSCSICEAQAEVCDNLSLQAPMPGHFSRTYLYGHQPAYSRIAAYDKTHARSTEPSNTCILLHEHVAAVAACCTVVGHAAPSHILIRAVHTSTNTNTKNQNSAHCDVSPPCTSKAKTPVHHLQVKLHTFEKLGTEPALSAIRPHMVPPLPRQGLGFRDMQDVLRP